MDDNAKELMKRGNKLFEQKAPFDSLCQEIAVNFYSARADFTTKIELGNEFASHQVDSYPELVRRDLANAFAYMVPCQTWETDENGAWVLVSSEPGDPVAVYTAASDAGVICTQAEVDALFAAADVTTQEPFVAMARLGLTIVNPPMEAE